jgi:hypothetical protein
VKTPSSKHTTGSERSASRAAALPWLLGILVIAALVWLLLTLTGVSDAGSSLLTVAWVMVVLSLAFNALARHRRRRGGREQDTPGADSGRPGE